MFPLLRFLCCVGVAVAINMVDHSFSRPSDLKPPQPNIDSAQGHSKADEPKFAGPEHDGRVHAIPSDQLLIPLSDSIKDLMKTKNE